MTEADSTGSDPLPAAVGVVTVSYGSESVLPEFVRTLARATVRPVELIIADNKPLPSADLAGFCERHSALYLPLAGNPGYGAAVNAAVARLSDGIEWVVVSNPDVAFGDGSVEALLDAAVSDPTVASVGPAIRTITGELYPSARAIPSLRNGIGHALFANIWQSNPWTQAYQHRADEHRREAGWLSGACLIVNRDAFNAIGGYDSRYFMYFEDVDLGFRFGKNQKKNLYEPSAVVTHTGAHSTKQDQARMTWAHHTSARRFLAVKYPQLVFWPVRAALGLALYVRGAAQIMRARAAATHLVAKRSS